MNLQFRDYFKEWSQVMDFTILSKTLDLVSKDIQTKKVYPIQENTFNAFMECPFNALKVVILGQDPYPNKLATGIAFANPINTVKISPSLKVILNSIDKYYNDLISGEFSIELQYLCRQGVLLLNSALTVIADSPGSHSIIWRSFIGSLLHNISIYNKDIIFVLLGKEAQSFKPYLHKQSSIVECGHPAYYARTNTLMPNIFKQIDDLCISKKVPLIFWK